MLKSWEWFLSKQTFFYLDPFLFHGLIYFLRSDLSSSNKQFGGFFITIEFSDFFPLHSRITWNALKYWRLMRLENFTLKYWIEIFFNHANSLFKILGTLSVGYLLIFVITKSVSWGINLDFTNTDSEHFVRLFKPSFFAASGMLPLSLFIHNIVITLMRNNRDQEHNVSSQLLIIFKNIEFLPRHNLLLLSKIHVNVVSESWSVHCLYFGSSDVPANWIHILHLLSFKKIMYRRCKLKIDFEKFSMHGLEKLKVIFFQNMLNNFPSGDIATVIARIFLFFQLLTVFPLLSYMLRVQIFSALHCPSYPGIIQVVALNSVNIIGCVLFAVFLPHIGTIIR